VDVLVRAALEGARRDFRDDMRDAAAADRAARPHTDPGPGAWRLGPSDYLKCRMAIWYANQPREGLRLAPTDESAARAGQLLEDSWVAVQQQRYPWREYQVEVRLDGIDRPGRMDIYDPITATVDDCKSLSEGRWEQLMAAGPFDDHIGQVMLYALGLEAAGRPVHRVSLTYVNRSDIRSQRFTWPWDDDSRKLAEQALDWLLAQATMLDLGIQPDRDRSGPSTDPICRNCRYRLECWNIEQAQARGRSPESYTVLGADPDDERVAWALAQIVGAREVKNAAEKGYEAVQPLAKGLKLGPYGEFEIVRGRKGGINWKDYHERTVEWASQPEATRGDISDVPVPYNSDSAPIVKRRRAANRKGALPRDAG
jgi:hypothetical protein